LTVGINYKINLTTYFACAYPQHGGGEGHWRSQGEQKGHGSPQIFGKQSICALRGVFPNKIVLFA